MATDHTNTRIEIYSSSLTLSDNTWVEELTTDIPFLTIGIVAIASVSCLLLTQRLTIPAACIVISAFLAFSGGIFDFARLLQNAKGVDDPSLSSIIVLREVTISLSIALNYLFFLFFVDRPPRGEVNLAPRSERERVSRESPSRWAYWGTTGYAIQAFLATQIIAVAVLEMFWRIRKKAGGKVYLADGIVEGVLSVAFLGKLFLNCYLSPLMPRWKTARDYSPVIIALVTRLAIVLASEFCIGFTESSLGRFLQAIQLYILIVFTLISPYYGVQKQDAEDKRATRPASSFRGVGTWSVIGGMGNDTGFGRQSQFFRASRTSPTQRLSTWLSSRLAPKRDPQQDRLWNKERPDLEAPPTPADRIMDDESSPSQAMFNEKMLQATYNAPYVNNVTGSEGTGGLMTPFSVINAITSGDSPIRTPPAAARFPPKPSLNTNFVPENRNPNSNFTAQFQVRESYESDSDSPIYGINGVIRAARQEYDNRARRSVLIEPKSAALDQLRKEQEGLERSIANMAMFSPSKVQQPPPRRSQDTDPDREVPSFIQGTGPSESLRSDFSLRDFPSPPASLFRDNTAPSPTFPAVIATASKVRGINMTPEADSRRNTEKVDDMQFDMVPPQMPAAVERRRASFPSAMRESATSSADGMNRILSAYADSEDDIGGQRVRMSGTNNRLDVTSFIGELTTPSVGRIFGGRGRNDSYTESRLSPLMENASDNASFVEIVDIATKSPSFQPAVAISTNNASMDSTRAPKVSFAPMTYDLGSTRNKPKPAGMSGLSLPSNPRPIISPNGSPRPNAAFRPVAPSPLGNQPMTSNISPTSINGEGIPGVEPLRRKPSYPGLSSGNRPVISKPMPLQIPPVPGVPDGNMDMNMGGANEGNYRVAGRATPAKTQRF